MKHRISTVLLSLTMASGYAYAEPPKDKEQVGHKEKEPAKDIDHIIDELTRQHDNASSLVKSAREPVSLASSNALFANEPKKEESILNQLSTATSSTISKFKQSGLASWYGRQFHGKKTASGERFDMNALTAAHPSLPLNCYVKVTNKANGQSVVVRINDRGPFHGNRVLDLSYGAAKAIGITQSGTGNVTIERVDKPN